MDKSQIVKESNDLVLEYMNNYVFEDNNIRDISEIETINSELDLYVSEGVGDIFSTIKDFISKIFKWIKTFFINTYNKIKSWFTKKPSEKPKEVGDVKQVLSGFDKIEKEQNVQPVEVLDMIVREEDIAEFGSIYKLIGNDKAEFKIYIEKLVKYAYNKRKPTESYNEFYCNEKNLNGFIKDNLANIKGVYKGMIAFKSDLPVNQSIINSLNDLQIYVVATSNELIDKLEKVRNGVFDESVKPRGFKESLDKLDKSIKFKFTEVSYKNIIKASGDNNSYLPYRFFDNKNEVMIKVVSTIKDAIQNLDTIDSKFTRVISDLKVKFSNNVPKWMTEIFSTMDPFLNALVRYAQMTATYHEKYAFILKTLQDDFTLIKPFINGGGK